MRLLARVRSFLSALVLQRRLERDMEQEWEAHLEARAEALAAAGMPRADARRQAGIEFGDPLRWKEQAREARGLGWIQDLRADVQYAFRQMRRAPGFTGVVIATLALGIGANTAIFTVVHAVLLKPLPYEDADLLVRLVENVPAADSTTGARRRGVSMSVAELHELRGRTGAISHAGLASLSFVVISGGEETVRLEGARYSPAIFQMRGVRPLLGRVFDAGDEVPGGDGVIILSHVAWRRYFGGEPAVLGRTLTLEDAFARDAPRRHSVIGVMPQTFEPGGQNQFWIPFPPGVPGAGGDPRGPVVARLADGVSLQSAAAEVGAILSQMRGDEHTDGAVTSSGPPRYELVREKDEIVAPVKPALLVLMVAVGFVLLIACVNVTNLVLARTSARRREFAVRLALGAGRGRVGRQLVTESMTLALLGGLGGTVLAFAGVRLLRALATTLPRMDLGVQLAFPRLDETGIDLAVLAFTSAISLMTGLLCGLAPAIRLSGLDRSDALREGAATADSGVGLFRRSRMRGLLVVAEIGMAMMLLAAGGLLLHSFARLATVDLGYESANVLTFQLALPAEAYPNARLRTFAEDLVSRLRVVPGVRAAAYARQLPLVAIKESGWFRRMPDLPDPPPRQPEGAPDARLVSRDYLSVMGIGVVAGRGFSENDRAGQPRVLLINETLARREFPGQNPVGQQVYAGRDSVPWEIAGVVADVRQFGLDQEPEAQFFADFRQWPAADPVLFTFLGPYYTVRTDVGPMSIIPAVRAGVRELDARAGLYNIATMEQLVANRIARPRMYAVLLGLFAALAAGLALVGVYGVMAYVAAGRTREIGIRMALGAQHADVVRLVLRQSVAITAAGIVLGLAGAVVLTRYLEGMLFGLSPLDPTTLLVVSLAFAAVATLASYVPARRAASVDPLLALRCE
jgi:predicted permease